MSTKLYLVRSKLKNFRHCQNVEFTWSTDCERPPVFAPLTELIENYDTLDKDARRYAEASLCELMTLREAEAVLTHLVSRGMDEVTIEVVELPIPSNSVPALGIPRDRWEGSIALSNPSDSHFPGKIFGYFDLSLAERSPPLVEPPWGVLDPDDEIPF